MHVDLTGMSALVTGASRGLGKAIALKLAEAGARIVVHANQNFSDAEELVHQVGNGSIALKADLAQSKQTERLFYQAIDHVKRLDILINNAGIAIPKGMHEANDAWLRIWEITHAVNLRSPALLCKLAIAHFKKYERGGRIINISSRAAFRGDAPDYLAYASSKAGLVSLTRSIARAYGKSGVKAFLVAPGFVLTDMAKPFMEEYGEEYVKAGIVLDQLTTPENIAPLVTFIASGLADHATGTTFHINAGSYMQ